MDSTGEPVTDIADLEEVDLDAHQGCELDGDDEEANRRSLAAQMEHLAALEHDLNTMMMRAGIVLHVLLE